MVVFIFYYFNKLILGMNLTCFQIWKIKNHCRAAQYDTGLILNIWEVIIMNWTCITDTNAEADLVLQMVLPVVLLHSFLQPGSPNPAGSHSIRKLALCLSNCRVKKETKLGILGNFSFGVLLLSNTNRKCNAGLNFSNSGIFARSNFR